MSSYLTAVVHRNRDANRTAEARWCWRVEERLPYNGPFGNAESVSTIAEGRCLTRRAGERRARRAARRWHRARTADPIVIRFDPLKEDRP